MIWLKDGIINTLCTKFKIFYQKLLDNKNDVDKNTTSTTKVKKALWERVCIWYREWWKTKVHPLIGDLKDAVGELFDDLDNAKSVLWEDFVKLVENIGQISKDMNCLTKSSTIITAA